MDPNRRPKPFLLRRGRRALFGDASVPYGFGVMAALALLMLWWAASYFRRATA